MVSTSWRDGEQVKVGGQKNIDLFNILEVGIDTHVV